MLKLLLPAIAILLLPIALPPKLSWVGAKSSLLLIVPTSLLLLPYTFAAHSHISIYLDTIGASLITLSLFIAYLIILASQKTLSSYNSPSKFILVILALNLILLIAFSTINLIVFYIAFEASLIPTLILIIAWGYQPERVQAGLYLLFYTVAAALPFLYLAGALYTLNSTLSLGSPFWTFIPGLFGGIEYWPILIAVFLIKTPLFLTHLWLPKAHVEAPVAGSIILAGILLKLGTYGLVRVLAKFDPLYHALYAPALISISLTGAVITRLICIRQTDIKSLIAYSSVGHMGLIIAGISRQTKWGWVGALALIIAHGLCSSCLFRLAYITYETTQTRSLASTKGMLALFPAIALWWFIFSACNIGAPPSINLAGEIILITRVLAFSSTTAPLLAVTRFLAAAYSLFLYTSTQHGPPSRFINPLSLFIPRNFSTSLAHFIPLVALILKIDLILL